MDGHSRDTVFSHYFFIFIFMRVLYTLSVLLNVAPDNFSVLLKIPGS